jgi:hypothetical protein
VGKLSYVHSENPRLLRPNLKPTDVGTPLDRFWVSFPLLKFAFDDEYYAVLDTLMKVFAPITAGELLARLRQNGRFYDYFPQVSEEGLAREILHKLGEFVALYKLSQIVCIALS